MTKLEYRFFLLASIVFLLASLSSYLYGIFIWVNQDNFSLVTDFNQYLMFMIIFGTFFLGLAVITFIQYKFKKKKM